jgi:hypothetical protein
MQSEISAEYYIMFYKKKFKKNYLAQTLIATGCGLSNNLDTYLKKDKHLLMAECISIWIEEVGAV